jgi:disulfide bond formation protein DsbB
MTSEPLTGAVLRAWLAAGLAGMLGLLIVYGAAKASALGAPLGLTELAIIVVLVFVLTGVGVGLSARVASNYGAMPWLSAYLGIAAGVVFWAIIEEVVFSRLGPYPVYEERNLFPLEIVFWCVVATIPIAAGVILVRVFSAKVRSSRQDSTNHI